MALVAGVDGAKGGWVAVVLEDGAFEAAVSYPNIGSLLTDLESASVIGIDISIGLPDRGRRQADAEAKRRLGPRRSSVFWAPPRDAVHAPSYAEANELSRELSGHGMSKQAYGLRPKILEVDAVAQSDNRIIEVHPEVSFWALADETPLNHNKHSWNGQHRRRRLLADAGIHLPDRLDRAGRVPVNDLLDAAIAAWTAHRRANGEAKSLPNPPEVNDQGQQMAIWY